MSTLTPRDALREVRENLASTTGASVEEAIAVLTALVERAGEPVAWMPIETAPRGQYEQIIAGFAEDEEGYSPDSREMWFSEESQMWKLSSDPNWSDPPQPTHWQPLPTAPGASHER